MRCPPPGVVNGADELEMTSSIGLSGRTRSLQTSLNLGSHCENVESNATCLEVEHLRKPYRLKNQVSKITTGSLRKPLVLAV